MIKKKIIFYSHNSTTKIMSLNQEPLKLYFQSLAFSIFSFLLLYNEWEVSLFLNNIVFTIHKTFDPQMQEEVYNTFFILFMNAFVHLVMIFTFLNHSSTEDIIKCFSEVGNLSGLNFSLLFYAILVEEVIYRLLLPYTLSFLIINDTLINILCSMLFGLSHIYNTFGDKKFKNKNVLQIILCILHIISITNVGFQLHNYSLCTRVMIHFMYNLCVVTLNMLFMLIFTGLELIDAAYLQYIMHGIQKQKDRNDVQNEKFNFSIPLKRSRSFESHLSYRFT